MWAPGYWWQFNTINVIGRSVVRERRIHYKSEQSLLLRSVASILTHKKKEYQPLPHPASHFSRRETRSALLLFFNFLQGATSRISCSLTIPTYEATRFQNYIIRISIWHGFLLRSTIDFWISFTDSTRRGKEVEGINAINKCTNCYLHHFPVISFSRWTLQWIELISN